MVGVVVRCNRMKVAKTVEAPFNEAVVNNDLCRMVGTLEPEEVNENRQDNGMFKDNLLVSKGQSVAFKHGMQISDEDVDFYLEKVLPLRPPRDKMPMQVKFTSCYIFFYAFFGLLYDLRYTVKPIF